MLLTFYSLVMAVIASSLMIIAIFFLKRTRFFADTFGVWFMVLLYVLSLLRIFVPIEIPSVQVVIQDQCVLPPVMDVLENRSPLTQDMPILFIYVLLAVSVLVTLVLIAVFVSKQRAYIKKLRALDNHATEEECSLLQEIANSVFEKEKQITLIKTDFVSTPMVTGLFKNIVLLPDYSYDENELRMIFLHECTHLKNNDLLLKLLIHIYCCIFWWNPVAYLLKADMGFMLELKCDNKVCAKLNESERLSYIEAINESAKKAAYKSKRSSVLVSSGFVAKDGSQLYMYRIKNLLFPKNVGKKRIVPTVLVSLLMVAIIACSFLFIWQASYPLTEETHPELYADGENVSDETNAYLVRQEDGSYIFCFEGAEAYVSKEEYDAGGYEPYPVYDEPQ